MAISKITLNGVTQMDVTQKTVDANKMLDGITALKNDGTNVTGNIQSKTSSDLTVSGATVTAPAGHYENAASKTIPDMEYEAHNSFSFRTQSGQRKCDIEAWSTIEVPGYVGDGTIVAMDDSYNAVAANTTITPSTSSQTVGGQNWIMEGPLTVAAMPTGTVTAPASISGTAATVTTGTDTLTLTKTVSVTPSVTTAGYVSSGTAGNSSVSLTASVNTRSSSDLTNSVGSDNKLTVTAPAGYYSANAAKTINAASVTVGLNKGTASNHQITVSATKGLSSGYLNSTSQITTDSVSVSASELVSGNLEITENGDNIDVTNYATVSVDVPTGGGVDGRLTQDPEGYLVLEEYGNGNRSLKDPIRFFDYNGEIVASYTSVPTELPTVPGHEGLKNGVWNYTLQQITTQFAASGTCDIGANYMTTSEKTEIDIEFVDDARLSPYLRFAVNGTVTVDWGDGSATEDVTGTSLTTRKNIQHTYSQAGSYTITLTDTSGTYAMYSNSGTYSLLHNNSGTDANRVYSNCVKAIRIGKNCDIGYSAFNGCYSLSSITIPSGVTSIGNNAFYYCSSLSSITIPSSVTSIGNSAFSTCYSLSSVTIPSGVTSIGSTAFNGCSSLSSITIPSGVTSIAVSTFYNCYPLSSITIPSSVTSIGNNVFSYCYSLSSITILSGVTSIGDSVFYYCTSLSSITIPSSVTSVGSNAFQYCTSLSSITIPSGVTSIGNSAFDACYGMKEYHFEPTTPPTLGTTAFTNIQSDCIIYVPRSSGQAVLNAYKTATNWSDWASYIQEEPA